MRKTLIENVTLVNEGKRFKGSLLIADDSIDSIIPEKHSVASSYDNVIDGEGAFLLPGVIDEHVHFREPGMTQKGTIYSESRAAAAGGVTSFFDMPNTKPQTTTIEALEEKKAIARQDSLINYSFFFGATNENIDLLQKLDIKSTCGVKLFMGASTGNMLVDKQDILLRIFQESPLPIMVHCEDTNIINRNATLIKDLYGENPAVNLHPLIRTTEACYRSTALAVQMARQTGAKLHVAHISSERELELFTPNNDKITAEACIGHLFFSEKDYETLGTKIKCNPSIKTLKDQEALQKALNNGLIYTIGTDHAPHTQQEKQGGALTATSGMPGIQYCLVSMLELCDKNILNIERMVELMCHHPAQLFKIEKRGFLRSGYKADLVLVRPHSSWTVTNENILSSCKWSPFEGHTYNWAVEKTFCNGKIVYERLKGIMERHANEEISFNT